MKMIWNDLLALFFPRLCLLCGNPLVEGEEHICVGCLCDLPYTHFYDYENNVVAQLFAGRVPVMATTALFYFEQGGRAQALIHALKYHDNKELGYYLGRQAALNFSGKENNFFAPASGVPVDCLIPVPLHPRKQRQRGYNQSEWIAKGLSSVLRIPVETGAIRRIKSNETQTQKQLYERWENVQDIFALAVTTHLEGKHILLVDDVITTGSTIGVCAETLLAIPGVRISILGIAVTKH